MALSTGQGQLNQAFKVLLARWEETKSHWNDPVSKVFEAEHIEALEKQFSITMRGVERLAHALDTCRRDCS